MSSCLGIYINDDVVKYAKLSYEKNNMKLEQYGTRFVKIDKLSLIENIIKETKSEDVKIAMTPEKSEYINLEAYDQGQVDSHFASIVNMEYEAWCEKNGKSPQAHKYIYKVAQTKNSNNKRAIALNVVENEVLDKYTEKFSNISSIYPASLLTQRLVSSDEHNYILVDFSDTLTIIVVINDKIADIRNFKIGMKDILKDFSGKLGSYQKAYEACKQINVFSEGVNNNSKELELLLEPILQEILKDVQLYVTQYRKDISKIILTGNGIIFTNIDILFTEYLDEKCEILRPSFIEDTSNVRNTADMLESVEAMALAYDMLMPKPKENEYVKIKGNNKQNKVASIFKTKRDKKTKEVTESIDKDTNITFNPGLDFEKIASGLICGTIAVCFLLIAYIVFGNIYLNKSEQMKAEIEKNIQEIDENIQAANSDSTYIETNARKYKTINDDVQNLINQIENNEIGKFSTYNVATFLQNIIKIIPKNVQLVSISSDDNKNVKITAKSSSYADLGYFVAELKINSTLRDLKINNIKNGTTTVIEIGGELP